MKKHTSFPTVPCLVVLSAFAGTLLWSRLRAAPPTPISAIAGLDASGSDRQKTQQGNSQLGVSRAALARLGAALNPQTDHLIVMRVDYQINEFYAQAPQGYESFLTLLLNHTQKPPQQPRTLPAKFWILAAAHAADPQLTPGEKVVIAYYGNGDNDDLSPASHAQIAAAARTLAKNPRVLGIWIYGAKPQNWGTLRELFAPLRGRLHLTPREGMNPQPLLDEVDAARRAAS